MEQLYEAIKNWSGDIINIGILGLPGSGKTTLSKELRDYGSKHGIGAVPWETDIYSTSSRTNRSRIMKEIKEKYNPNWPERAYTYDLKKLSIENFAKPQEL